MFRGAQGGWRFIGLKGRRNVLFVHGAWSSAWYWLPHNLPFFSEAGWSCAALSLRGHGESDGRVRRASVGDYVADVRAVAETMENPVIVGHSMGGFVAQHYAARFGARGLGLLAAAPPGGVWPAFGRAVWRHPLGVLRVNLTLDLCGLVASRDFARDYLWSREPEDRSMDAHLDRLQSESFRVFLDMLFARVRRPAAAPVFVLGAAEDRVFGARDVARTGAFYGVAPVVIGGSHMLTVDDHWRAGAEALLGWMDRPD